jgi:hypothetical protein
MNPDPRDSVNSSPQRSSLLATRYSLLATHYSLFSVTSPRPPLDRVALERVLSRAAQLHGQQSEEPTGALSDEQILELGKEVGLAPDALRQAIAEERGRSGLPVARGIRGAWFGATTIASTRVVPGAPATAIASLDELMRGELSFDVKRRYADGIQWEPKRGFFDTMKSQLAGPNIGTHLRTADDVAVTVVAVDAQRSHVRVEATIAQARGRAVTGSTLVGGVGVGSSAFLVALVSLNALLVVPPIAAVTLVWLYGIRRAHRQLVLRTSTALEQLLDRVEFGAPAKRAKGFVEKLLGQ